MSKKWSQKTEKLSVVADDEFLILDSEDANPATNSKRVRASTLMNNGANRFTFQTVGATTQQQSFIFNGALSVVVMIAASNAGGTKGYAAHIQVNSTIMNNNNLNVNQATDFVAANASPSVAGNTVTITLTGEAGETIDWKGYFQLATI